MHDELACLSKAKLFSGLPQPVLEAVNQVATHRQFFKRGALVAGPLDAGQLLVIDEGQLQVTTSDAAGQRRVLDLLPAGMVVGQERLFSGSQLATSLEAATDAWVCSIAAPNFQRLLRENGQLALVILNAFGQRLASLEKATARRELLPGADRVVAYLTDWAAAAGSTSFRLPISKQDFAGLIGVAPATLSRQLTALQDQGVIAMQGRQITLCEQK